jgi:hypothetical protein
MNLCLFRTRTPSGSNTPIPAGMQTAASRLLMRKTSESSDIGTSTSTQRKKSITREPFRL